jgi:glyoxylase-like metal-dependent hydrolase (beta-lactamase superfamily II)
MRKQANLFPRLTVAALCLVATYTWAQTKQGTVEAMYVLDCGMASAPDLSQWTPGAHEGKPANFSNNCYLIKHRKGWMLWDTGISDDLATLPDGKVVAHEVRGIVRRPLAGQLKELGIEPKSVNFIAFSHGHFDHVGNSRLFPQSTWLVQAPEYSAMFGPDTKRFGFLPELYATMKNNPRKLLSGDHDVFGDGSVLVLSTPGHTPGHQSLLVRLPRTGTVILSGDAVHLAENFAHRRAPSFNADAEQTKASIDKLRMLSAQQAAQLWINHDRQQSEAVRQAPQPIR